MYTLGIGLEGKEEEGREEEEEEARGRRLKISRANFGGTASIMSGMPSFWRWRYICGKEGGREGGRGGRGGNEWNGLASGTTSTQNQTNTKPKSKSIKVIRTRRHTYIAGLFEQMKILLFLGRLPNDGRVRGHFPHIWQVFKLLVIGRIGNNEGVSSDLCKEVGGRPRRGGGRGGLHAQRRGAGVVVGASREGGSRAPGAGRVEGGGEEKEGGPGSGAARFDGHVDPAAAAAPAPAAGSLSWARDCVWGMEGGEVRRVLCVLWFETCLPSRGDEKSMQQGHTQTQPRQRRRASEETGASTNKEFCFCVLFLS